MSLSGRAKAALRQAEAEGLTLLRAESNSSGYKCVSWHKRREAKPYRAEVRRGGTNVSLASYATPEEAALCYARSPEGRAAAAAPPEPPPLTAEEALRQAETEGLTLLKSEGSSTGYKGVSFHSGKTKPYQARVIRDGKEVSIGNSATPEEAALSIARSPEGRAAAAAPPEPPPMTAEEALQQAEAEGLTLLRSDSSSTGFKGVSFDGKNSSRFYQSRVARDGRTVSLGYYATPEEAALSYARSPEGRAAAAVPPVPPPLTPQEVVRQAEAEGLTLLRSESSNSGYVHVTFNSRCKSKPYKADVRRGGKPVYLGYFATPEEAALCYARTPEAQAAAAAPPEPPPMTAEEALQQAEAEGLTLLRSNSSSTGYKGVRFDISHTRSRPYEARVRRGGKLVTFGYFATAEEAALCVAHTPEAQAAAEQPTATSSSRKRKVKS